MHSQSSQNWEHKHVFLGARHKHHERRTWLVVGLTIAMMLVEIVGGGILNSMALVADGWHMSTHALALGIAAMAYHFARIFAEDRRLTFGTGKFGELAGFSSALILAIVAILIGYESVMRWLYPASVAFSEAIPIAVAGLVVNLVSAWLLHDEEDHHHTHGHDYDRHHSHQHHHDNNHRAAYVHVLADALTSMLAIIALVTGRYFGAVWLDPLMGIIGACVILAWSQSLIRSAGAVLIDAVPNAELVSGIRQRIETNGDRVADLHLWRLGPGHIGAIVSIVSSLPQEPAAYKARLKDVTDLSHVTVEVQHRSEQGA